MRMLYNQLAPAEHPSYPDAKRTIHISMSLGVRRMAELVLHDIMELPPDLKNQLGKK